MWYRKVDNFSTIKYWGNYLDWPYGLRLAMKCLTDLHTDVKENHGVDSVMGSHTDQNCAESGFGQIRGMGAANNDPNAQELMQRVSRWTTHRILKFDPDFNIMCLKEPLEKYIEDFTSEYYEDDDDEFDYDTIPDDLSLEHEVPPVQSLDVQSPEVQSPDVQSPEVQDSVASEQAKPILLEDGKDIYTGCLIDIFPSTIFRRIVSAETILF